MGDLASRRYWPSELSSSLKSRICILLLNHVKNHLFVIPLSPCVLDDFRRSVHSRIFHRRHDRFVLNCGLALHLECLNHRSLIKLSSIFAEIVGRTFIALRAGESPRTFLIRAMMTSRQWICPSDVICIS
jgi:hypothetical protein